MNNLVEINNTDLETKEFKGQRVLTFKEIDLVHERVEGTAKRNFNENKEHFIEGVDYFKMTYREFSTNFVPNSKGGNPNNEVVLLTESGYLMLVKSLSDDLAWTVQRELVNKYFRVKSGQSIQPQSSLDLLELQVKALKEVDGKVQKVNSKVEKLDKKVDDKFGELPLFTVDSKALSKLANSKMTAVLGGKKSPAYKKLNRKGWADLYGQVHREFGVSEIGAIKRKDLEKARQVIIDYVLPTHLKEQVEIANNQIEFEEAN